jgi:superoxide dismutase, Cu-Zn family
MWKRHGYVFAGIALLAAGFLAGCTPRENKPMTEGGSEAPAEKAAQKAAESATETGKRAVATLEAKSGSELTGEAFFVQEADGKVSFGVHVEHVKPGLHAVHIHENGDCSAADGSSAGGHWNPTGEEHGKWGEHPFHLGDIGNIDVGPDGTGSLSLETDLWNLNETGDHSVLGHAVVVHAGADDFKTQPSGDAGARIGCGVITLKKQM